MPGATSYMWYVDGVLKSTTTDSYYHLPMSGNVSCGNFYYFGVKAVSSCGTSEESYIGAEMPPCEFAIMVSPNPSSDNINITLNEGRSLESSAEKSLVIQEIQIVDKVGILKQSQKFSKGMKKVNFSVRLLSPDVYTLRIFDGKVWHTTKIVIQR